MFEGILSLFKKLSAWRNQKGKVAADSVAAELKKASRRDWKVEIHAGRYIYISLLQPLDKMEPEIYRQYLQQLNSLSDAFFIENNTILKCRLRPKEVKRFLSIIKENGLKLQKLVNDGVNPR